MHAHCKQGCQWEGRGTIITTGLRKKSEKIVTVGWVANGPEIVGVDRGGDGEGVVKIILKMQCPKRAYYNPTHMQIPTKKKESENHTWQQKKVIIKLKFLLDWACSP